MLLGYIYSNLIIKVKGGEVKRGSKEKKREKRKEKERYHAIILVL